MWRCFVNEILTLKETQTQNRFKCCAIATKRRNIVTYHFGSKIMTDWKLRSARRFECARCEYKRIHHAKRSRTNAKQCKHNTHTTAHQSRTQKEEDWNKATTSQRPGKSIHLIHQLNANKTQAVRSTHELTRFWFFCCAVEMCWC